MATGIWIADQCSDHHFYNFFDHLHCFGYPRLSTPWIWVQITIWIPNNHWISNHLVYELKNFVIQIPTVFKLKWLKEFMKHIFVFNRCLKWPSIIPTWSFAENNPASPSVVSVKSVTADASSVILTLDLAHSSEFAMSAITEATR